MSWGTYLKEKSIKLKKERNRLATAPRQSLLFRRLLRTTLRFFSPDKIVHLLFIKLGMATDYK